jgi:hypothetical protein
MQKLGTRRISGRGWVGAIKTGKTNSLMLLPLGTGGEQLPREMFCLDRLVSPMIVLDSHSSFILFACCPSSSLLSLVMKR